MNKHRTHNFYSLRRDQFFFLKKKQTCWGHLNSYNWAQLISTLAFSITKLAVWCLASTLARTSYASSDTSLVPDGIPTEPRQDAIEGRLWLTNGGLSRQMLAGFLLMRPFAWVTPLNEIVPIKACIPKEVGLKSQRIGVRFLNLGRGLILMEPPNVNPTKWD